jgi:hypothetical protein
MRSTVYSALTVTDSCLSCRAQYAGLTHAESALHVKTIPALTQWTCDETLPNRRRVSQTRVLGRYRYHIPGSGSYASCNR